MRTFPSTFFLKVVMEKKRRVTVLFLTFLKESPLWKMLLNAIK